jgi:methylated-DNA-[protein]-cysteine S-methyltransferase
MTVSPAAAPLPEPGQEPGREPVREPVRALRLDSPAGNLVVREQAGAIVGLAWLRPRQGSEGRSRPSASGRPNGRPGEPSALLVEAARQLHEYFAGRRQTFDLPLSPAGSAFHQKVWRRMRDIPFGRTATYGDLARDLGCAAQPVGSACAANPIAIVIPCHRVVATTGLGGFSGGAGVESKRFLLHHEGALDPELDLF